MRAAWILLGVLALMMVSLAARATRPGRSAQDRASRAIVVLSDLHMGIGREGSGSWHPSEDFRWAGELGPFLDAMDTAGRGATDLILNGDTFELWQPAEADCVSDDPALGCTEREALARLDRVLAAHRDVIDRLSGFARSGSNRVMVLPGDHDAALLFPAVGRRLLDALAAPAGRVNVAASGYWLSADGRVYAEHGHQMRSSAFRFDNWPSPFVPRPAASSNTGRTEAGVPQTHLFRSWGERVVQRLVNRLEARYPVVDNMAAVGVGLKYALAAEDLPDQSGHTPWLLRMFLFTMPWQQFRMELDDGDVEPPVWDVTAVRAQGAAFLVTALPDDDPFKPFASAALKAGQLSALASELTDDEIVAICDYRAAVRRARRRFEPVLTQLAPRGPVVAECPRTADTRGVRFDYFWRSRDLVFRQHLEAAARHLPDGSGPITVFVHGHTHLADRSQAGAQMISGGLLKIPLEGFSPVRGALTPVVVNGGAWQRTVTPVQLERLMSERGASVPQTLQSLQPEHLAPCYSFVRVAPYADVPTPEVRYWRPDQAGRWEIAVTCGIQPGTASVRPAVPGSAGVPPASAPL